MQEPVTLARLHMVTFEQLRTFLSIAKSGSVSRAADDLYLTQSAVSQRLKQLEDVLGASLFVRDRRRTLSLTYPGELAVKYAADIVSKLDELQTEIAREANGHESPSLIIALGTSAATQLLPALLQVLVGADPRIVTITRHGTADEIAKMVLAGEADLGIRIDSPREEQLSRVFFKQDRFGLISSGDEVPDCSANGLAALSRRPFALQSQHSVLRQMVDRWAKSSGLHLSLALETMNLEAIAEFVSRGLGYSILPEFTVHAGLHDGRLRFTPVFGLPA